MGGWECGDDRSDLIRGLKFEQIDLSADKPVTMVEAGAGCGRGGQGSNGAMWLIRFQGDEAVLLAGPAQSFNGWLYAVQAQQSHGYRDVVLGWHMSSREAGLSYFRFDGKLYRMIGTAKMTWDDNGNGTIAPQATKP